MQKNKAKEPRLIVGVIILMISNIIVKVIGVLFKIPLHDLLGDRGMSYFNIAYNLFTTLYLVSTAGLPTAISMMVSEARVKGKKAEVRRIFRTAVCLFSATKYLLWTAEKLSRAAHMKSYFRMRAENIMSCGTRKRSFTSENYA